MREIILTIIGVTIICAPPIILGLAAYARIADQPEDAGNVFLGLAFGAILVAGALLYLAQTSS